MRYVLIVHEVTDFSAWKKVFDDASAIRKLAGEVSYQLLKRDHDANSIVHFSKWESLQSARRFFESPELVEIRKRAGVMAPQFLYLEQIEQGDL